ncbi:MAG: hypothetical protein K2I93_06350, partial [Oscillospiraceae bacterium]|nr:hypothetical protein [Oscillospiraceae bacterium]
MKLQAEKIMVGVAAAVLTAVYCPLTTTVAESLDEPTTEMMETTETAAVETEGETQEKLSSVTVVHTAKINDEGYEPTDWWKA